MATKKKCWDDPFLATFEARGATSVTFDGKPALVLGETIFYPRAAGSSATRASSASAPRPFA